MNAAGMFFTAWGSMACTTVVWAVVQTLTIGVLNAPQARYHRLGWKSDTFTQRLRVGGMVTLSAIAWPLAVVFLVVDAVQLRRNPGELPECFCGDRH